MWNQRNLKQPPVSTEQYTVQNINRRKLREVYSQLYSCIEACKDQIALRAELTILSRLYYKFKNQWRREKCLRNIKQIEGCLKRWLEMQLEICLTQLLELVPGRISVKTPVIYLPSASMAEYALLRLLGAARLLLKCTEICMTTYENLVAQLSAELFVQSMTIVAAAVSRVWVLSKSLHYYCSRCYAAIRAWLPDLNPSMASLVSDEGELPMNIDAKQKHDILRKKPDLEKEIETTLGDSTVTNSVDPIQLPLGDESILLADNSDNENDDIGRVLNRDAFYSEIDKVMTEMAQVTNHSTPKSIDFSLFTFPAVKRAKKFLSSIDCAVSTRAEDNGLELVAEEKKFALLAEKEYTELCRALRACTSFDTVRLFLTRLNRSHPQVNFRGMKKCIARLCALRHPSRKRIKELRQKENKVILKQAQTYAKRMLKLNRSGADSGDLGSLVNEPPIVKSNGCIKSAAPYKQKLPSGDQYLMCNNGKEFLAGAKLIHWEEADEDVPSLTKKSMQAAETSKHTLIPKDCEISEYLSHRICNAKSSTRFMQRLIACSGVLKHRKRYLQLEKKQFKRIMKYVGMTLHVENYSQAILKHMINKALEGAKDITSKI